MYASGRHVRVCSGVSRIQRTLRGNKRVKPWSTDHRGTEILKSKEKKRNTDLIFATETETDVSRTQYKRMALACQLWTQNGENATQIDEAR